MGIDEAEARMLTALELMTPADQLAVHIVSLRLWGSLLQEPLPSERPYLYLTGLGAGEFQE